MARMSARTKKVAIAVLAITFLAALASIFGADSNEHCDAICSDGFIYFVVFAYVLLAAVTVVVAYALWRAFVFLWRRGR
jgi:hypothetical protein